MMRRVLTWTTLVVVAAAIGLGLAMAITYGGRAQALGRMYIGLPSASQGITSTVPYGQRGWGMGPGMMWRYVAPTQAYTGTYGPRGGWGMGPGMGMMGGWGRPGFGPQGRGYGGCGMGPGMRSGGGYGYPANATPLTLDQAAQSVNQYLAKLGNSDLKLAEVMQFDNGFYAEIKEKSTGLHAFEILIDPYTGAVYPEPGPNMMWNAKYGMMGGRNAPAEMPVTAAQARQNAQTYLDDALPGAKVADEADTFYGYYTIHVLKDGKVFGMLSVNGYTGQVWYHTWHGTFVDMKEFEE